MCATVAQRSANLSWSLVSGPRPPTVGGVARSKGGNSRRRRHGYDRIPASQPWWCVAHAVRVTVTRHVYVWRNENEGGGVHSWTLLFFRYRTVCPRTACVHV